MARSKKTPKDTALILGQPPGSDGVAILRRKAQSGDLQAGLVRPLQEGKPIVGEVVRLRPRRDFPLLCDVDTQFDPQAQDAAAATDERATSDGPPQVATDDYRAGWDRIWGHKRGGGAAN